MCGYPNPGELAAEADSEAMIRFLRDVNTFGKKIRVPAAWARVCVKWACHDFYHNLRDLGEVEVHTDLLSSLGTIPCGLEAEAVVLAVLSRRAWEELGQKHPDYAEALGWNLVGKPYRELAQLGASARVRIKQRARGGRAWLRKWFEERGWP